MSSVENLLQLLTFRRDIAMSRYDSISVFKFIIPHFLWDSGSSMRPPGGLKSFLSLLFKHSQGQVWLEKYVGSKYLHMLLTIETGRSRMTYLGGVEN